MSDKKEVYIVGGPNGAGKTTFVAQFLPKYVNVSNFINADNIAKGLSPLGAPLMDITSGKLMLKLIDKYRNKGENFAFEETLAGKTLVSSKTPELIANNIAGELKVIDPKYLKIFEDTLGER
ncbi:hypothetical protein A2625_05495 [candidate division WOR-1 bacterium RIFCSPHIGHO2_01_FULL_53_15]|uniref:UDP-N-acetylglucosamine kinase n=1 Tax=candidate division WOR-1 bacterium RIFCSPHIGHO2_01_FULL_53_15 TaxID=1802564 RepID=A0A1F4Q1G8_UNCSA|nr:MAG: hypothetical protein A2625_05495 [candidate division WOR-1 bacterium RIFCSPHIGHO2_01_FULL_53_15]OGC13121.1 MAG: hypothetical protein A3D23_00440 [candidate division WOR-1 bacterium RIFCSPHIGHO2_02_FULL_53_26]